MSEHAVMEKFVRVRRIREEDMPELVKLAAADNHVVLKPTHVVAKDGEIVGYYSIGAVPVVLTWLDTKKMTAAGSVNSLCFVEDMLQSVGADCVCIPCWESSPFFPYMEKFGYQKTITTTLFVKELKR